MAVDIRGAVVVRFYEPIVQILGIPSADGRRGATILDQIVIIEQETLVPGAVGHKTRNRAMSMGHGSAGGSKYDGPHAHY